MKNPTLSGINGRQPPRRRDRAVHQLRRVSLLVLFLAMLFSFSCHPRRPAASSQPTSPTAEAPPAVMDTPADPWAAYRSLLAGDTLEKQRQIFLQGYRFFQEKNGEGARLFFTRALEVYPLLADYSAYYLGLLSRTEGQSAEARRWFGRVLTDHPESIWVSRAALELAKLALSEGLWEEAAQHAERARKSHVALAAVQHEASLVLAQAQEGQGNVAEAYSLYQELRRAAPRSPVGKTAKAQVERLRALEPARFALATDHEYLDEIRLLTQEDDPRAAEALAHRFSTQFPSSPLRPEVLTLLAAVYKQQGRVEDAIHVWRDVTTRYPHSAMAPAALYAWASLVWNRDRDDEARQLFEKITKSYPHHKYAAEAWYAIGRIFQERRDDQQATKAYQQLAALFSDHPLAREGRWRQAWMAYRRGDFHQAEQRFAALARAAPGTPEGESALYWQARAADKLALADKAAQGYRDLLRRYPDGYYAWWAERRLNISPPPLEPGTDGVVPPPSLSPPLESHYRRSQELHALGLPGFARRELDLVRAGAPHEPALLRFLLAEYHRLEGYAVALRLAYRLLREGRGNWQRYLFPHAYWDIVSAQAEKKRLDPYLVLAIIRQESLFDPEAVSPARAYGLMQLLPTTAARMAQVPSVTTASLTNPGLNIELGTTYLRRLLDLYDNNLLLAIAGYNAGEQAVDKWRARYPDLEPDEFVESISYRETRNYVKLVLRNYRTYRRLYEKTDTDDQRLRVPERSVSR